MANIKDIKYLREYISSLRYTHQRAYALSLIKIANRAEGEAKKNATKQFIGRNDYTLSGRLLNSITHGYNLAGSKPTAWVGTQGIPYGAIHEFGGKIVPKRAKHLWQSLPDRHKKGSKFRRMTPSEFMSEIKAQGGNDGHFFFYRNKTTKKLLATHVTKNGKYSFLFFLRKSASIPERPYLRPGAMAAVKEAASILREMINAERAKGVR